MTLIGFLSPEQLLVAGPGALLKPPENKDTEETLSRDGRQSQQLDCVCYGLGSFSSCVSARYQLALLLLLLDAGQVIGYVYPMKIQTPYMKTCSL